jgi:hypothetical protein
MSKRMMIAFVEQMLLMAKDGKTAVERMKYVPAGVKDGTLYSHNGFEWGGLELQDCEWISADEANKARIADSKFVDYMKAFKKLTSDEVAPTEDVKKPTTKKTAKEEVEPEPEDVGLCDEEILLDIQEAVDDGDIEDAEEIMKELKNKDSIAKAKKIIAGDKVEDDDEDEVTDEDLIDELQTIIDDIGDDEWTDDDIVDAEDVIADIEDKKLKVKAKKLLAKASTPPEVEDDLTEDEAIEEIKLAIEDGDKNEAQELLKFIKDARQLRRYTRKVKGM